MPLLSSVPPQRSPLISSGMTCAGGESCEDEAYAATEPAHFERDDCQGSGTGDAGGLAATEPAHFERDDETGRAYIPIVSSAPQRSPLISSGMTYHLR